MKRFSSEGASDSDRHSPGPGLPMDMASLQAWRAGQNPHLYNHSMLSGPPAYDAESLAQSPPKHRTPPTRSATVGAIPQYTPPPSANRRFPGYSDNVTRSFTLPVKPVPSFPANDPRRFNSQARSASRYRDENARTFSPPPSTTPSLGHDRSSSFTSVYGSRSAPQTPMSANSWTGLRHAPAPTSFRTSPLLLQAFGIRVSTEHNN